MSTYQDTDNGEGRVPSPERPRVGSRVRFHSGADYGTVIQVIPPDDRNILPTYRVQWDGRRATWEWGSALVILATPTSKEHA